MSTTAQLKPTANITLPLDIVETISANLANFDLNKPLIHVETTKYGGRGYFSSVRIPANTTVLSCDSPITSAVFRQYKKDTCAYCFKCDFHKPCKVRIAETALLPSVFSAELEKNKKIANALKVSNKTAYAGLFFCSEQCRDDWAALEDPFGVLTVVLNLIDQSVPNRPKNLPNDVDDASVQRTKDDINKVYLDLAWENALSTAPATDSVSPATPSKKSKKAKLEIPYIDSAEHDNARIVAGIVVKTYVLAQLKAHENELEDNARSILAAYTDDFETFDDLQSNEQQLIQSFPALLDSHITVYKFLAAVFDRTPFASYLTPSLFRQALGKEAGNAFGIWQYPVFIESECLGSSIYPAPSFFNHACEHNIEKRRKGRKMEFVTTRDIDADQELYISYGMFEDLEVHERQKMLFEQWHFKCGCPKCERQLKEIA